MCAVKAIIPLVMNSYNINCQVALGFISLTFNRSLATRTLPAGDVYYCRILEGTTRNLILGGNRLPFGLPLQNQSINKHQMVGCTPLCTVMWFTNGP